MGDNKTKIPLAGKTFDRPYKGRQQLVKAAVTDPQRNPFL